MPLPAIAAAGLRHAAAALAGHRAQPAGFNVDPARRQPGTPGEAGAAGAAPSPLPAWLTAQMQVGGNAPDAAANAARARGAYAGTAMGG